MLDLARNTLRKMFLEAKLTYLLVDKKLVCYLSDKEEIKKLCFVLKDETLKNLLDYNGLLGSVQKESNTLWNSVKPSEMLTDVINSELDKRRFIFSYDGAKFLNDQRKICIVHDIMSVYNKIESEVNIISSFRLNIPIIDDIREELSKVKLILGGNVFCESVNSKAQTKTVSRIKYYNRIYNVLDKYDINLLRTLYPFIESNMFSGKYMERIDSIISFNGDETKIKLILLGFVFHSYTGPGYVIPQHPRRKDIIKCLTNFV